MKYRILNGNAKRITLFLICTAAIFSQTLSWNGRIDREGDVVIIRNPKEPMMRGKPVLILTEDWSITAQRTSTETEINHPMGLAADRDGNIFVLDFNKQAVVQIDEAGRFVKTIGQRGVGPGSLNMAFFLAYNPRSNTLAVLEIKKRLSLFNVDGRFLRAYDLKNTTTKVEMDSSGNNYLWERNVGNVAARLIATNSDMAETPVEIIRAEIVEDPTAFDPNWDWTIDILDRVVTGDGKSYEICFYRSDGKLVRKVLRDAAPMPVPKSFVEKDRKMPRPAGLKPPEQYPAHLPAYKEFFCDDRGNLFVRTWERTANDNGDIHDVFDAEGRFIGRVALNDYLFKPVLRDGKLYVIEGKLNGRRYVKRYSVAWTIMNERGKRP